MFNDFATWPCKMCWNGWECVGLVWKALKCYSVQKSCEKSTKCPYRFVFKSWLVMCSLAMFYFKILLLFCYKHPHDSHVSKVLKSCQMKPCQSHFLMYLGKLVRSINDVFEVCWHITVFLTRDHVISLNQRRNLFKKGHLYIL